VLLDDSSHRYVKALYAVAMLLILVPLADVTLRSFTTEFGSLQWRFGTVGLLFGNLGTVVLGLGLAGLVATILGNRGVLRGVGLFSILLAVALLAMMALFALDALQMRRLVAAALKRQVLVSSAGAAFSAGLATLALAALGRGALLTSRGGRPSSVDRRAARPAPAPLVAQTAPQARPRATEPV
jgi:hypothetical protein